MLQFLSSYRTELLQITRIIYYIVSIHAHKYIYTQIHRREPHVCLHVIN